jgi:sortase (surface protein transpeptidase)
MQIPPLKKSIDSNNVENKTLSKEVRNKKLDFKNNKRVQLSSQSGIRNKSGNIIIHGISIGSGPSWKETTQSGISKSAGKETNTKANGNKINFVIKAKRNENTTG